MIVSFQISANFSTKDLLQAPCSISDIGDRQALPFHQHDMENCGIKLKKSFYCLLYQISFETTKYAYLLVIHSRFNHKNNYSGIIANDIAVSATHVDATSASRNL